MPFAPKSYTCRHIFTDGHQCGSPALRGEELCFYHHASRRPQHYETVHGHAKIVFAEPLDLHAIQRALAELIRLTAADLIDLKQASAIHRFLATSSQNLARIDRQDVARAKADPNRQPVHDYTNHPTLGTLAPVPATETGTPATPEPRPEGPVPDPVIPFTPEPEIKYSKSQELLDRGRASYAQAYFNIAREVQARLHERRALTGHDLDIYDRKQVEYDPELKHYLQQIEYFGLSLTEPASTPDTPQPCRQDTIPTVRKISHACRIPHAREDHQSVITHPAPEVRENSKPNQNTGIEEAAENNPTGDNKKQTIETGRNSDTLETNNGCDTGAAGNTGDMGATGETSNRGDRPNTGDTGETVPWLYPLPPTDILYNLAL